MMFDMQCSSIPSYVAVALALVAACGSDANVPATPAPASESAVPEPAVPEPAVPEPASAPDEAVDATPATAKVEPAAIEPVEPELAAATTLRTVAVREGVLSLARQRDEPLIVMEGEPVRLRDGVFTRDPSGSAGLWPDDLPMDHEAISLAAVSLDEPLGAWSSAEHEVHRMTSVMEAYQRRGDRWRSIPLRKGVLEAYYGAFVERDGALLALRSWMGDPRKILATYDEEGEGENEEEMEARESKVDKALARAKQSWVRIAGAEGTVLPKIPANTVVLGTTTTTADGTLMAVAVSTKSEGTFVLCWPPGEALAVHSDIPDSADASGFWLGSSGEWNLLSGGVYSDAPQGYLAIARGNEWQRVAVTLPGRDTSLPFHVSGAARLPDGELWIAIADHYVGREGSAGMGGGEIVWRKPLEGTWQPVPLPKLGEDPALEPEHATGLLWAAGAVWILVGAGSAYEDDVDAPTRSAVLTTAPGTGLPTVLPNDEQLARERGPRKQVKAPEPGSEGP